MIDYWIIKKNFIKNMDILNKKMYNKLVVNEILE